jgi:hypothetical protein
VEVSAATPASRRLHRETLTRLRTLIERATVNSSNSVPEIAIEGMIDGMIYVIAKTAEEEDAELPAVRRRLMAWFALVFEGPHAAQSELRRGD